MNTQYTSLELSRDLQEAGFSQLRISKYWYELVPYDDESDCFRELLEDIPQWYRKEFYDITKIPAYDILWDLCVRYSQEVW